MRRLLPPLLLVSGLVVLCAIAVLFLSERQARRSAEAPRPGPASAERTVPPPKVSAPGGAEPERTEARQAEAEAFGAHDPPREPGSALSISGRVVGPRGEPIAGARVRLLSAGGAAAPLGALSGLPGHGPPLAETVADGSGAFQLAAPAAAALVVEASASGFAAARTPVLRPAADGGSPPLLVRLERGVDLAGRVLAADTLEPIAGALVRASRPLGASSVPALAQSVTAADGSFRLEDLPPVSVLIRAEAEGFGAAERARPLALARDGEDRVVLRLPRAPHALSGVVLVEDARGSREPAARAVVRIERPDRIQPPSVAPLDAFETRCDALGRFGFEGLAAGEWRLVARLRPGSRAVAERSIQVPAPDVEIVVPRAGRVRVRGAEPGTEIRLVRLPAGPAGRGRTLASLRVSSSAVFEDVPPGRYRLETRWRRGDPFEVEPGADIVADAPSGGPGARLFGRVVDSDGRPVRGALVRFAPRLDDPAAESACAQWSPLAFVGAVRTDADGAFSTPAPAEERGCLLVLGPGGVGAAVGPLAPSGRQEVGTVTLPRAAEITGRIVDRRGDPVAGRSVVVSAPEVGFAALARGDHRGLFRVKAPAGRLRLRVLPDPSRDAFGPPWREVEVAPSERREVVLEVDG